MDESKLDNSAARQVNRALESPAQQERVALCAEAVRDMDGILSVVLKKNNMEFSVWVFTTCQLLFFLIIEELEIGKRS